MRVTGIGLPVTEIRYRRRPMLVALGIFHPSPDPPAAQMPVSTTQRPPSKWPTRTRLPGWKTPSRDRRRGACLPTSMATGEDDEGKVGPSDQTSLDRTRRLWGDHRPGRPSVDSQCRSFGRHLRRRRQESQVLRSLGAGPPRQSLPDALNRVIGAIAVGSLAGRWRGGWLFRPISPLRPRSGPSTRPAGSSLRLDRSRRWFRGHFLPPCYWPP